MKSFKSLSALIILAFGMVSTLQAQKKLANDIYTYNYAGIINKNNGKAIAKVSDYPQSALVGIFSRSG
jgi:hypothetical protein